MKRRRNKDNDSVRGGGRTFHFYTHHHRVNLPTKSLFSKTSQNITDGTPPNVRRERCRSRVALRSRERGGFAVLVGTKAVRNRAEILFFLSHLPSRPDRAGAAGRRSPGARNGSASLSSAKSAGLDAKRINRTQQTTSHVLVTHNKQTTSNVSKTHTHDQQTKTEGRGSRSKQRNKRAWVHIIHTCGKHPPAAQEQRCRSTCSEPLDIQVVLSRHSSFFRCVDRSKLGVSRNEKSD